MKSTRKNKQKVLASIFVPVLILFFASCSQDSIFYNISIEPELREAIIPGSPTNIITARNHIFVGTRMGNSISFYGSIEGNLRWSSMPVPGGVLGELATDGTHLYALIFPGGEPLRASLIRRFNLTTWTWDAEFRSPDFSIQTIHGARGFLFAGGQSNTNRQHFAVMHLDHATSSLHVSIDRTSLLTGAAAGPGGTIFLSTLGSGIFAFDRGAISGPLTGTPRAVVTGIIETGGVIIGVGSTGNIYYSTTGVMFNTISTNVNFTGALNVWLDPRNNWRPSLLLMGIRGRGTSLTQGYREMVLNNGQPTFIIRSPGEATPSSVQSRAIYQASIGILPVHSILQVPDISRGGPLDYRLFAGVPNWSPPIFASTSRSGLWSYRDGEWNAED